MKKQLLILTLISMFVGNSLLAGHGEGYEAPEDWSGYEEIEDNTPAPAAAAAVVPVRTKGSTREETIDLMRQQGMNPDEYNIGSCGCYSLKEGGGHLGHLCRCDYESPEDEGPVVGQYTKSAAKK